MRPTFRRSEAVPGRADPACRKEEVITRPIGFGGIGEGIQLTGFRVPPVKRGWPHGKAVALHLYLVYVAVVGGESSAEAARADPLERPTMKLRVLSYRLNFSLNGEVFDRCHLYTADPDATRSRTVPSS